MPVAFCANSHPGTPRYQWMCWQHWPVPQKLQFPPRNEHRAIQFSPSCRSPVGFGTTVGSSGMGRGRDGEGFGPVGVQPANDANCPHRAPFRSLGASSQPGVQREPSIARQHWPVPQKVQLPGVLSHLPKQPRFSFFSPSVPLKLPHLWKLLKSPANSQSVTPVS